jgi:hypothetical protein
LAPFVQHPTSLPRLGGWGPVLVLIHVLPEPTLAHGLKEHFAGYLAGFPSYQGVPPTGRRVEVPGCEFLEVRGDRVRRVQGYIDRLTILNQLGLATP